jgi:hypothetical protein
MRLSTTEKYHKYKLLDFEKKKMYSYVFVHYKTYCLMGFRQNLVKYFSYKRNKLSTTPNPFHSSTKQPNLYSMRPMIIVLNNFLGKFEAQPNFILMLSYNIYGSNDMQTYSNIYTIKYVNSNIDYEMTYFYFI